MDIAEQRLPGDPKILLLPGWHNSGPGHWQTLWEEEYGDQRVTQHDWSWPRRGDWMARLDEVIQAQSSDRLFLVAHSLGCQLLAAWAAHSAHACRVRGALLVAPVDTEREDAAPQLSNWRPVPLTPLPFPSSVIASSDDPYCSLTRSKLFAERWGSKWIGIGSQGHINAESKLGSWREGRRYLTQIVDAAV